MSEEVQEAGFMVFYLVKNTLGKVTEMRTKILPIHLKEMFDEQFGDGVVDGKYTITEEDIDKFLKENNNE
jgi:hypothetical protein